MFEMLEIGPAREITILTGAIQTERQLESQSAGSTV